MQHVIVACDYRGGFQSKVANVREFCSLDKDRIVELFRGRGWTAEAIPINVLLSTDIRGAVLLTSAEDQHRLYKQFIESVAFALEEAGQLCLPRAIYIKAHHNKVLMEALKAQYFPSGGFATQYFGTLEDLATFQDDGDWPKVIKPAHGAGSKGVQLVSDVADLRRKAEQLSRSFTHPATVGELAARVRRKNYVRRSTHRAGFIVQRLIRDLPGDYKVLVYGDRYYLVQRSNRPNDFTASASGILDFEPPFDEKIRTVLDFVKRCYETLKVPMLSVDIGLQGLKPYLLEFQCVSFGPLTAEKSSRHFIADGAGWRVVEGRCDLEEAYVHAVIHHLT